MSINQTTSFIQDLAHEDKSTKFIPIQPSQIATVLAEKGFELVHLKSGQARTAKNAAHQTTIARYRSNTELKVGGLNLDLVFKVPHIYGSLEAFLGTYRQVCTNGLVVGHKFFEIPRIRHTGNALEQLEQLIPLLISKHDELGENIAEMSARNVTPEKIAEFIKVIAIARLGHEAVNINYADLVRVRRQADTGTDAFTVLNVVQENVMRYGLRYQTKTVDEQGRESLRHMTARPMARNSGGVLETASSVDLNATIWDAATNILMAA